MNTATLRECVNEYLSRVFVKFITHTLSSEVVRWLTALKYEF